MQINESRRIATFRPSLTQVKASQWSRCASCFSPLRSWKALIETAALAVAGRWEHFAHDADIGVRGIGPTLEQAFEQAAFALMAVVADPSTVAATNSVALSCEASNDEDLLYDWLNAIVFAMATRRMIFGRFKVRIHGHHLRAIAWGEPIDVARHAPAAEVKGATYSELRVHRDPAGQWIAQCVVDV
jgi:SHS2 domain-containing protein